MIASVGAVCDLDLVVIGGGVAKSGALLFDPLREALATYAGLDFLHGLRVVPAELGGDAGLVGAAALVDFGVTALPLRRALRATHARARFAVLADRGAARYS